MAILIDELPFFGDKRDIKLPDGEPEKLKANQILLWMSIRPKGSSRPNASAPRFPVIFDSGLNISMTMRRSHFLKWVDHMQREQAYVRSGRTSCNGRNVSLFSVEAWLYRNAPDTNDQILNQAPNRIVLAEGLGVYDETKSPEEFLIVDKLSKDPGPRLPTLGILAITANQLSIHIDGKRRRVRIEKNSS